MPAQAVHDSIYVKNGQQFSSAAAGAASGWKRKFKSGYHPHAAASFTNTQAGPSSLGQLPTVPQVISAAAPKAPRGNAALRAMVKEARLSEWKTTDRAPLKRSVTYSAPNPGQSLRATHGGWVKGKTCVNKLSKTGPTSNKCRVGVSKANPAKGARQHPQGDGYMRKKPVKKK